MALRSQLRTTARKHSGKCWYLFSMVLSFGVSLGLTTSLHEMLGLPKELAFAITLVCVMVMNFFVSRHLVYKAAHGSAWKQFRAFVVMAACFRGTEYLIFLLVVTVLGAQYQIALVCIQGTMAVCKYLVAGKLVFRVGRLGGLCTACGYDLAGLPVTRDGGTDCPECGALNASSDEPKNPVGVAPQ